MKVNPNVVGGLIYGGTMAIGVACVALPIADNWSNRNTGVGLLVASSCAAVALWKGRELDQALTKHQVFNYLETQYEFDRGAEALNGARLAFDVPVAQTLAQLESGNDPVAQIAGLLQGTNAIAALPPAQEIKQSFFEVEDLAEKMALEAIDRQNCGSILIACPKGTGKSNLLRAAISATHKITNGDVDFSVFNGKEDIDEHGNLTSTFCGLEKSKNDYISAGDPENIPDVASRLKAITKTMDKRKGGCPMVQILDEYNNILIATEIYDEHFRYKGSRKRGEEADPDPEEYPLISMGTTLRMTKGRSRRVCDWITSHSPFVQDIDINTKLQESFSQIVLGRYTKLDALYSALKGTRSIVKNIKKRDELLNQLTEWEAAGLNDKDTVVALTNLGGQWRIVQLPRYPDKQPDLDFLPHNRTYTASTTADNGTSDANQPRITHEPTANSRQWLESLYNLPQDDLEECDRVSFRSAETQNTTKYSDLQRQQAIEMLKLKQAGKVNQTQIIKVVFGLNPGDSQKYRDAVSFVKELEESLNGHQ